MDNMVSTCPICHQPTSPEWYFCPNCGKELKAKLIKIPLITQIGIYALSIFLPPLGLWPGIKYLGQKSQEAKMVGIVAITLTIVSSVVTIWLTFHYLQSYLAIYNGLLTNPSGLSSF
ncbi:MAG: hypothetical protein A2119_03020 [Candidatus Colwellbacteria bacterium GWA2_46_10]|uniref:Zinc-ribbon domain-containing protein n=1 Tax=Candidatus Colwellbacteria bacterium GWA2_46_10 TaxID=1797684 RepID=A0A1G1YWB9_9BACT|nr:MAG: hypothetical protein UW86_C0010G0013 [Microgenomates group bacterium GW2011_GWA1_Microgenomates_45_10]OGY56691.1 MAG: hypothetical protein A2119_03020 [Candidatus Colwellbacteria bacterium GWA2_46_10]